MGLRAIIEKLVLGDSTKKNVEKLNKLIEHVNENVSPYVIVPDDITIHSIPLGGDEDDPRLAANVEFVTIAQYKTLVNGQPVNLEDGRRLWYDENCIYYVTDDNGDPLQNLIYKRSDMSSIRTYAEEEVIVETATLNAPLTEILPTLAYLYAYRPTDGPYPSHDHFSCIISKLNDETIEIEACDMATGHKYTTVKSGSTWTDWIPSHFNNEVASADIALFVSAQNGSDINGAGTTILPYATITEAMRHIPQMLNNHKVDIFVGGGEYEGFQLRGRNINFNYWGPAVNVTVDGDEKTGNCVVFKSPITITRNSSAVFFDSPACEIHLDSPIEVSNDSSLAFGDSNITIDIRESDSNTAIKVSRSSVIVGNGNIRLIGKAGAANGLDIEKCSSVSIGNLSITNFTTGINASGASSITTDSYTKTGVGKDSFGKGCKFLSHSSASCQVYDRRALVVNNTEESKTFLVGTITATSLTDYKTTFRVSGGYKGAATAGLLTFAFRLAEDRISMDYINAIWEYKTPDLPIEDIFFVYRIEDNNFKAWMYANIDTQYNSYIFDIVRDHQRERSSPDDDRWEMVGYSDAGITLELVGGEHICNATMGSLTMNDVTMWDGFHTVTTIKTFDRGTELVESNVTFSSNGHTFIGSGDSAEAARAEVQADRDAVVQSYEDATDVWNQAVENGENPGIKPALEKETKDTYITAEDEVKLYVDAKSTSTTKKGLVFTKDGVIRPTDDTSGNITFGDAEHPFNNVVSKQMTVKERMVIGDLEVTGDVSLPQFDGSTFGSELVTGTYLKGNQGEALVSSKAPAGQMVALMRLNSTNGKFLELVNGTALEVTYTSNATVDGNTNEVTKKATLLDESGNSNFPGTLTAGALKTTGDANVNTLTASGSISASSITTSGSSTIPTLSSTNITASSNITSDTLTVKKSATAVAPSSGSYLRNIGVGTAEASSSNCPVGSIWGKYT